MLARTDTARLVAFVDQTHITKVAWRPALTSPPPESDWIRTHSCGFAFLGFGLGELGFGLGELDEGLGFGVLGFGLGVVELGLGEAVAVVDDEPADDEDEEASGVDVLGLDEGLSLAGVLAEADLLLLPVADFVGVADELAELNRDADELASVAAGSWLAASVLAADS